MEIFNKFGWKFRNRIENQCLSLGLYVSFFHRGLMPEFHYSRNEITVFQANACNASKAVATERKTKAEYQNKGHSRNAQPTPLAHTPELTLTRAATRAKKIQAQGPKALLTGAEPRQRPSATPPSDGSAGSPLQRSRTSLQLRLEVFMSLNFVDA
jgi:hypothetical protein